MTNLNICNGQLRKNLAKAGIEERVINLITSGDLLNTPERVKTMEVLVLMHPKLSECDAVMYALYIGGILK
ncbi:MAG: hypothetical protein KBS41_01805 [Oscillospiraceae bacterium]|nr:hypothetical protein [Candidatus Equicaccousia limihippi]